MTACPHGEPSPACCLDCLDGTPPPPPPLPYPERVIEARHTGRCQVNAAHPVEEGDPIGLVAGLWACRRCYRVAS